MLYIQPRALLQFCVRYINTPGWYFTIVLLDKLFCHLNIIWNVFMQSIKHKSYERVSRNRIIYVLQFNF